MLMEMSHSETNVACYGKSHILRAMSHDIGNVTSEVNVTC